MKKIFVSNWVTLDGIFAGPKGETDWFSFDKELEQYNLEKLLPAKHIIFGRTTYDMMADYWPSAATESENPEVVKYMNESTKHTFSTTVTSSDWDHCFFYKNLDVATIEAIKEKADSDLVVLGSGDVAMQLHRMGMIDQYNILLDPQLLGQGKVFFQGIDKTSLELVSCKTFKCGVNYLEYKVRK